MAITEVGRAVRAEREVALVLAATPSGPLAHAIDAYRQAAAVRVGSNAAHRSPPHCPLARSCCAHPSAVSAYRDALAATLTDRRGECPVMVTTLITDSAWHGLEIESPFLLAFAAGVAERAASLTRRQHVTVQRHLRLALANGFEASDHDALSELAHRIVDPTLPAGWDVGLWQRANETWGCLWQARVG